ncbi:MAG: outer membrane beta-barrel protein [Bacteroidia bacterium]
MKQKYLSKFVFSLFLSVFFCGNVFSQDLADSSALSKLISSVKISGYVDAYYAFYTDSAGIANYQQFPSVSPRSNAFGLNTAMLTAQLDGSKIRGIVSLHYGDIARSAWSPIFNPVMEAHAGFRLCDKLWFDAGFFRTHFGTEGLLPKENIANSISVCTFYEPYFESGFRLNYNPNDKLAIYLYALNGYNMFDDNNRKKSLGLLATYALGDKGNIGYSNYTGDDSPEGDTISHLRMHNNLFFNYAIKKMKFQVGGDFCVQQHSNISNANKAATMYSGVASVKYQCCGKLAMYARGEMFNDPQGVMSGVIIDKTNKFTGYKMWGATYGLEYKPLEDAYLRLEGRYIQMDKNQEIFHWNNAQQNNRFEVMLNFGVSF